MNIRLCLYLTVIVLLLVNAPHSFANDITLAAKGKAQAVIVVPAGSMAWDGDDKGLGGWRDALRPEVIDEKARRIQRDSVIDLAHYLQMMSGSEFEIVDALPKGDSRTPIYIGSAAQKVFGPVGITMAGKFGFRVVSDAKRGVGLYGESPLGTSYAIYELLHRLGCRWYMPSKMGEVVPSLPTVTVDAMDLKLAPATEYRALWGRTGDDDFFRRNRMNGNSVSAGHALSLHLKYWEPEEAKKVADGIIAELDKKYVVAVSLSPHDGVMPTEDPEGRKHDPEPRVWEPAAGRWSTTDRLMMLVNRVAEQVNAKYPDVTFGMLAYVNYNSPPAREPVNPNVIPVIAPIDFNRHHPMDWPNHPNEYWLRDLVEGWAKKADRWGYYAYGMNLAETTAPCPFITKWGTDLKILMDNHMTFWMPETMGGWESMMPGFYLSVRMTFDPQETPDEILSEMWTKFYGPAAVPMEKYWMGIDRAWIDAEEHAGCFFGYLRIFTPEVMSAARKNVNDALAACKEGSVEMERVKLIDASLSLFELFMKTRHDWANARFKDLDRDLATWRKTLRERTEQYAAQKTFRAEPWSPGGAGVSMSEHYINSFAGKSYTDATRMDTEFTRVGKPMIEWKWKYNPDEEEASMPWTAPDFDDSDWPTMHVVRDTWSTIGHHNSMTDRASGRSGRMAYRTTLEMPAAAAGKRTYLWIGSTDGSAKVFVNGKHVKYVLPQDTRRNKAGDVTDRFTGYCQPAQFDVTDVLQKGENQITILAERLNLNEIGTGGLMGPVVIYRDK